MHVAIDQLVNQRIARSSLAPPPGVNPPFTNPAGQQVFIANPWVGINASGIGRPTGTGSGAIPELKMPVDGNSFKPVLTTRELSALGWSAGRPPAADVDKAYLSWGGTQARQRPFFGVCDGFACAVVSILVAKQSPLAPGATVEWFGMFPGGFSGVGHAFVVVDRPAASTPGLPGTWGNNCFVVDQWYALQAGSPAAMYVNGAAANANYVAWLTAANNDLRVMATFTAGAYNWLSVPPI